LNNWNGIVSLLIACIEFILIINIFIFAERNKNNYIAALIIFLLMIYQLLEWIICGLGLDSHLNAYLAFTDISFLPPLGLFFVLTFYKNRSKLFVLLFLPAAAFVFYYSTIIDRFNVNTCTVFYAIYKYPNGNLYGLFYYLPILITIGLLIRGISKSSNKIIIQISKILLTAYILVSLPVIIAFILALLNEELLLHSIVSVMCKFALLLAIALTYFAINFKQINE
jgi:hypothetical protein